MSQLPKQLKITLENWEHNCGDGCCYSYGTLMKIDGSEYEVYQQIEVALQKLCEHLGIEAEIDWI